MASCGQLALKPASRSSKHMEPLSKPDAVALYTEYHSTARALAAHRLRELAAMIAAGELILGTHKIQLPPDLHVNIGLIHEHHAHESYALAVAVCWDLNEPPEPR